jgi:DNA repair exonuclease SbcCD ATPase subunit
MFDDAGDLSLSGTEDETTSKQRLRELVEQYRKENATLKSQLDEFTPITTELERLHAENTKLSSQVRSLRVEKDDALQRLEIGLREVRDLNDRLSEQKRVTSQQLASGQSHFEQTLEQTKAKHQRRVDELSEELTQARTTQEQVSVEHSLLLNQVGHLLEAAQRHFQARVKDVGALTALLQTPPLPEPALKPSEAPDCERRVRKLKGQLRERTAALRQAEEALQAAEKETQRLRAAARQNDAQKERIAALTQEMADAESRHAATVSSLQEVIATLKAEITHARQVKSEPKREVKCQEKTPAVRTIVVPSQKEKELMAATREDGCCGVSNKTAMHRHLTDMTTPVLQQLTSKDWLKHRLSCEFSLSAQLTDTIRRDSSRGDGIPIRFASV